MPTHTSEGHNELFHHPVAKAIPAISTLTDQEERENTEELKGLVLNQAKAAP